MTPSAFPFCATTSGVPPAREMVSTAALQFIRDAVATGLDIFEQSIGSTFPDVEIALVDAAHTGLA